MRQQALVGGCSRVVEFVHHDVIEMLWRKAFQVRRFAQRLHRCAQHVHIAIAAAPGVVTHALAGQDADEGGRRLAQNFFTMRHKQNAPSPHAHRIKSSQPRLAETCRQNHQAASITAFAGVGQRCQGFLLNVMGQWWCLLFVAAGGHRACGRQAPLFIGLDPAVGQGHGFGVRKEFFKPFACFQITGVLRKHHAVVPLQPIAQGFTADGVIIFK